MKRRLFKLAIFLLLGAVVNVAVAWGCVLMWLPRQDGRLFEGEEAASLVDSAFKSGARANPAQCGGFERWGAGWSLSAAVWYLRDRDPGIFLEVGTLSVGWPTYSLLGQSLTQTAKGWYEYALMLPDVLRPLGPRRPVDFLPLRPLWPGFAINTVFYATILWLFIPGPFALRKHLRRKRGLCVACGYDIRHADHDACPECGATTVAITAA